MNSLQRINLFLTDVPEAFLREIIKALEELYPSTYDETEELPRGYQRYLRPHLLRTKAEIAFLTSARKHGLVADARENVSHDTHALVVTDDHAITLSRTYAPDDVPRWARFRVDYSGLSQYSFQFPEFGEPRQPVPFVDDSPRQYVLIVHGPDRRWRELGFVQANFVAPGGLAYFGKGLDLLTQFGAEARPRDIEAVREPEFQEEATEAEEEGGDDS